MKENLLTLVFFLIYAPCLHAQGNGEVISLTKGDFLSKVYNYEKNPDKWKYEGTKPCIVDFYADWCGPCKKMSPVLAELAQKYKDQIVIYRINTDKEKELTKVFGISSIPTLFFIPLNGEPQVTRGALSREDIENAINQVLLK